MKFYTITATRWEQEVSLIEMANFNEEKLDIEFEPKQSILEYNYNLIVFYEKEIILIKKLIQGIKEQRSNNWEPTQRLRNLCEHEWREILTEYNLENPLIIEHSI